MKRAPIAASHFSMVLGLANLGQAWRYATRLWAAPPLAGGIVLACTVLLWFVLLAAYLVHAARDPVRVADEMCHPVSGGTPALLAISTFLVAQAVLPCSRALATGLAVIGMAAHLAFSVWHTGSLWQGGRRTLDTAPTLYLPTVAGNFTGAAMLAALGCTEWAWLLFGAGVFSWLALEPLVIRRLWHIEPVPAAQRPSIGIQLAPPAVCASALLVIVPDSNAPWLVMLLGYAVFQMLVALRLGRWLSTLPVAQSWWAYTFGLTSATLASIKLALNGSEVALSMAPVLFVVANLFIGFLSLRTLAHAVASRASPGTVSGDRTV